MFQQHTMRRLLVLTTLLALTSCVKSTPEPGSKVSVAAAANLTGVLDEIGAQFRKRTGAEVVFSYGATAQLAQQIEHGAPFDVFAAADTEHVDELVQKGRITPDSQAVYTQGQLALWIPKGKE